MKTQTFDSGEFWLLPYPDLAIVVSATTLLVVFGLGYFRLVVLMLFSRRFFWDSHLPAKEKIKQRRLNGSSDSLAYANSCERFDLQT